MDDDRESPTFYLVVYAAITTAGLVISTVRFFVLYDGSIRASSILYKKMLEAVLFANMRFHDTVSRGRVLNRFGKDFEGRYTLYFSTLLAYYFAGIDSSLADDFGRTVTHGISAIITFSTLTIVGGLRSAIAICVLLAGYYRSEYFGYLLCKKNKEFND